MTPTGLIGVVHLGAMPGDPLYREGGFRAVLRRALTDAAALAEGGASALIIENFGSVPFAKGTDGARLEAHAVACMTQVADRCIERFSLPVGINCLRNDAHSALGIAAAVGAQFVRVNVHTSAMLTDQGLIEGEAAASLRYRASLQADVAILADVLVKHATPLVPTSAVEAAADTVKRGLADGLIVTGAATGAQTDLADLKLVKDATPKTPVFVGSGITPDNAQALLTVADGAIVGTWLKEGGDVRAPVDRARVRELAALFALST